LFVFPAQLTVLFVKATNRDTAMLEYVLDTAGAMLSKPSASSDPNLRSAAHALVTHTLGILALFDSECLQHS